MVKKVIAAVAVLAVLAVLGRQVYVRLQEAKKQGGEGPPGGGRARMAVAVELAPVRQMTVREIGRFTGTLSPRSQFIVAPKVAGRLEHLAVNVGDSVAAGQLIAKLDDDEYVQQVEQAKAELAVAHASVAECKSSLEVAKNELERVEKLWKSEPKVASDSEMDEVRARHTACEAKHNVALAEVTRREAALKAAEVRLSYTEIKAGWRDGGGRRVVGQRFVDEGAMLTSNWPIVSILDNSTMTAQIDVIERDYPKLKLGQAAKVETDARPGETFDGNIVRIAPLLKETSRQARVEIEIPNAEGRLNPGMFVRVSIEFQQHENATVVPVSAVARRDKQFGVFLADTQALTVRYVPVERGIATSEVVEVLRPPLSGQVVTLGHHLLEDGGTIRLPEARRPGEPDKGPARREGKQP